MARAKVNRSQTKGPIMEKITIPAEGMTCGGCVKVASGPSAITRA